MNEFVKKQKTVWVISDGIPGHFIQSKGVLFSLEQEYELKISWLDLQLKHKFYRRILAWLLNHRIPKVEKIYSFYEGSELQTEKPDVVIGAGGNSAYAVVWLAKVFQAKSIFCGSLRQLKAELFDAILVLEQNLPKPFISLTVSPMPLNQEMLKNQAEEWYVIHPPISQPIWTMLIGGDGAGANFQKQDWENLAKQMNFLARQYRIKWVLSTSRRTGHDAEKILQQYLNFENIVDVVWWAEQPKKVLHQFLGISERVFCSVDSMSMLMEGISAMRSVIAIAPEDWKPDERFLNALHRLHDQHLLQIASIKTLSQTQLLALDQHLDIEPSQKLLNLLKEHVFIVEK